MCSLGMKWKGVSTMHEGQSPGLGVLPSFRYQYVDGWSAGNGSDRMS